MMERRKLKYDEIEQKISDVLDSLEVIKENLPESAKSLSAMGLARDGLYKKVEFAIESILDICYMINSGLRLGVPETEDSMINHLENNKVFNNTIISLIRQMKGFRNILVHKYGEIKDEQAYEDIRKGLDDFELIIKEIERFLEKHKKLESEKAKKQAGRNYKKN